MNARSSGQAKRYVVAVLAAIGAVAVISAGLGGAMLLAAVRSGFSARDQPSAIEKTMARAMRAWSIPARAKRLQNPTTTSAEVLQEARAHWADHCAICHANDGSGATAIGRNLYPKAPDMRAPDTQGMTDGEIYYVIENGIRLTGMPAWGEGRDDSEDSWKLVTFIRHLPELRPDELNEMERLNPKGPGERQEDREEDDFLGGGEGAPPPAEHRHSTH